MTQPTDDRRLIEDYLPIEAINAIAACECCEGALGRDSQEPGEPCAARFEGLQVVMASGG